jgi:hypothetical protein
MWPFNEKPTASPSDESEPELDLPTVVTFFEAMEAVAIGKRITKEDWKNARAFMEKNQLTIEINGKKHGWIISQADLDGEDYIVIN